MVRHLAMILALPLAAQQPQCVVALGCASKYAQDGGLLLYLELHGMESG